MSKMIQLRNVPERLHRKLKARAATEGRSLSEYLLGYIQELAERPTLLEMRERLRHRESLELDISPTEVLRRERQNR